MFKTGLDKVWYFISFCLGSSLGMAFKGLFLLGCPKASDRLSRAIVKIMGADVAELRDEYDPIWQRRARRLIVALPSHGCRHFFEHGGCAMCGFNQEIVDYRLHTAHSRYVEVLVQAICIYIKACYYRKGVEILALFMAGSFLDERELPEKARNHGLDLANQLGVSKIQFELRADCAIQKKEELERTAKLFTGVEVEIFLGFEALDPLVRNAMIRKRLFLCDLEKAVAICGRYGCRTSAYVLFGIPFLTEEQNIRETHAAVKYAEKAGFDAVRIETYFVQANTAWGRKFEKGGLQLVNLWCLVDLIKTLPNLSPAWTIGQMTDWPPPLARSRSCSDCEGGLLEWLDQFRIDHDLKTAANLPVCACHRKE